MTPRGTISVARIIIMIRGWPRNLYFDRAKAAIEFTSKVISVAIVVTKTEFQR